MSNFTRRGFIGACAAGAAGSLLAARCANARQMPTARNGRRLNVLFLAVDDLRPQLGAYGLPEMHTPHLDRFASQGRLYERHYAQVPTCGASRHALLTGRYPVQPVAYGNEAFALLKRPDAPPTLPAQFRAAGYRTVSIGKISHQVGGMVRDEGGALRAEVPNAWDETGAPPGPNIAAYADGSGRNKGVSPPYEMADVPDEGYPDGRIAQNALAKLEELGAREQPFFLATGFYKPHLPFNAPKKYWDLYQRDQISLPPYRDTPAHTDRAISLHGSAEFFQNYGGHPADARTSDDYARLIRHAYFAATSYVDAQIGKVLDGLDRLGLRENTVVMVWGDHGWHLGDHSIWGKHTPFERALRSAFIARVPDQKQAGRASNALVESVDIWPTLNELCGLPAPQNVDGRSFADTLRDADAPGQPFALGFWNQKGNRAHTIRDARYRLIRWRGNNNDDGPTLQVELYDHQNDADETNNVAADNPLVVARLIKQLDEALRERAGGVAANVAAGGRTGANDSRSAAPTDFSRQSRD